MRARPRVAALGILAAIVFAPGARSTPGEIADAPEAHFDLLLPQVEAALTVARADTAFDAVIVIEAEETAAVAEELLQEGEAEIAVQLLEQALALLSPAAPE